MMHKTSLGLAALLYGALLATATPTFAATPATVSDNAPDVAVAIRTSPGEGREKAVDESALLRDDNARRAAVGIGPMVLDARLTAVARAHALDMIARGYFGHNTPEGVGPFARLKAAGVRLGYDGENLAIDASEHAAEEALYESPGHRANTLERHYAKVGIVAMATSQGVLFDEEFSD
jgi:uncharacterized protein YkwD